MTHSLSRLTAAALAGALLFSLSVSRQASANDYTFTQNDANGSRVYGTFTVTNDFPGNTDQTFYTKSFDMYVYDAPANYLLHVNDYKPLKGYFNFNSRTFAANPDAALPPLSFSQSSACAHSCGFDLDVTSSVSDGVFSTSYYYLLPGVPFSNGVVSGAMLVSDVTVSAVPETPAWAMLLGGGAMMALLARRRRALQAGAGAVAGVAG